MGLTPRGWRDVCLEDLAVLVDEHLMARGREYLARGHVGACLAADDRLAGAVLGSSGWYVTLVSLRAGEIEAACSCPYQGRFCKHAVALVLAWLADPGSFLDLCHASLLMTADADVLRRICMELCLAAPRAAAALLAKPAETPHAAAAALARNLLAWPKATHDPAGLAERLDWVSSRLLAGVIDGDVEAARAAVELLEKLLAAWSEAPAKPGFTALVSGYIKRLAETWPRARRPIEPERLAGLCRPERTVFAPELGIFLRAAGGSELTALIGEPVSREIFALLGRADAQPVKTASFESLLLLLDAYERWDQIREAAALAQAGLRRPDRAERYVLRGRLAQYHERLGERRQALAYLIANFRERPDVAGWETLRRTAMAADEWPRVKLEIWPVVVNADLEIQTRAALDEADPELLMNLAGTADETDRHALAIWTALGELAPEKSLDYLVQGARSALSDGGRAARARARDFLRAAGRLCRTQGWHRRWETIRAALRSDFPPALNWPELGAILSGIDDGDGTA
ncbi:MAG: SWIM zinc finger family protein [Bacteroidota bacterium]